jgi:hypothetical protein
MLLKPPRWVLAVEVVVVVCAALVLAYKAAMWVRPLGRIDQAQFLPKVDPATRVREYYARYPESYIRISRESWRYDGADGTARHKFTLTNQATVSYEGIRIELTYQSAAGEVLRREAVDLRGSLEASCSREISGLEIRHVPPGSETALLRVVGASVVTRQMPAAN